MAIDQNEIRDYLNRAPKRRQFDGGRVVNTTHVRFAWLCQIAFGTLDERINRRAGLVFPWEPWKNPIGTSIRRHKRRMATITRAR